jgi:hypothetical protein
MTTLFIILWIVGGATCGVLVERIVEWDVTFAVYGSFKRVKPLQWWQLIVFGILGAIFTPVSLALLCISMIIFLSHYFTSYEGRSNSWLFKPVFKEKNNG